MTMTTVAPVVQRSTTYADAEHLAHAQPVSVLARFGIPKSLPKNKGTKLKMRRWDVKALAVDSNGDPASLTEGTTPSGGDITYSDVEVTMKQYGSHIWN